MMIALTRQRRVKAVVEWRDPPGWRTVLAQQIDAVIPSANDDLRAWRIRQDIASRRARPDAVEHTVIGDGPLTLVLGIEDP